MAVKISGVLKDGAGKPVQNCTIQLKAKRNSTTVVVNTVASENPDEAGRYSMDVEYGQYSVILLVEGFPPSHAGTITVYEDSQPGTLNDFLGAMTEDDARPEALRRFELMVEEVARNASAVAQDTAAAKKSASDAGTSAREAATHATDATGSARAASTSAGQAATSAQSASSSAGTASTKATEASKSAAAAESSKSAAATSAGAAKTSETNAAASQQSAATSASTATTKASEAATSARDAAASKEAAKSSETNASSSASSAASSATAAGNSAKAAKTSETNADNSAQAAADSQTASANSATAAKKSETNAKNSEAAAKSSETNAKASETNAKSSETNAAKSAADALNYRNQAQVIVGDNIGLGEVAMTCTDISVEPSGYIGFVRIYISAKGYPSVASSAGDNLISGYIVRSEVSTKRYSGLFVGSDTKSLYSYIYSQSSGPQWIRHTRRDELSRFGQNESTTRMYGPTGDRFFEIHTNGSWGGYDSSSGQWSPLGLAQGGTGGRTIEQARANLRVTEALDATLGLLTKTGRDWNTQHTDNINKFIPIAGSTNGPAGSMVLGGIHVQFSKNYAVQFGGRNSGFWGRTIENGTTQEWKKLLTVDDLNSSTDLAVRSLTTSNPVKSGGGRIDVLGSTSDYSKMDCFVRGFDSTGNSLVWALGSSVGVSKMLSLKNFFSGAEILLNGNDGAVQLKTGAVNGATAQTLTINKNEVNSTVDLTLTKQSGTGNRFVLQNSGNAELPFSVRVWGSSTRQNVFEVGTSAAYLFYAQKTSAGQLFDVNGAINCTTLNQSSDRDLKDDILVISDATKAIRKMNGYTYTLRENGMPYAGVIAQEVMEAIPEAVGSFTHYGEELQGPTVDGNELREETRYLNVDYAAVTGLLVQVARETDGRVTALEEENITLRKNLATAGTRISTLENQVSELVALVRQLTGSEH
ncbi:prophage tail fiber N-terminal domain and S74 family endopeptidase-containing protein [Escherichia coli]|uniref:prophage tail fiber N-terminal domain and S74 family endopeptidase-containing protein n=1 Tax=Escherichia coli TaxID=562 RepID=UPI003976F087